MQNGSVLLLKASDVAAILAGKEAEIMERTRQAYLAHGAGETNLPQSVFLNFPHNSANRIIALPAYIGDGFDVIGIKWISSFPANIYRGIERASAIIILNSPDNGRPEAILEGSLISASRTAASAALAAGYLMEVEPDQVGLIGCGVINFEVFRFLLATRPMLRKVILFDLDRQRSEQTAARCANLFRSIAIEIANDAHEVIKQCRLISFATVAAGPHIQTDPGFLSGTTILHISLRDLSEEIILGAHNIVDDVEHVCRARTSVHLTEQLTGSRSFIAGTLADVISDPAKARAQGRTTIFSPFGLGILDLAVADYVHACALKQGLGTELRDFYLEPLKH